MSKENRDNTTKELYKLAKDLSNSWRKKDILEINELPFDVSLRRYYRIKYKDTNIPTAILMKLAEGKGPLGGGINDLSQNDTFVQLQQYLKVNQIRVPELYVDARKIGYLLVEDIGDKPLFSEIININKLYDEGSLEREERTLINLMKKSIDLLVQLQGLNDETREVKIRCVAFQRTPSFEQLRAGTEEFIEYILRPLQLKESEIDVFSKSFNQVCEEVKDHPKVFSHYDFTSHNIHLDFNGELTLIDFQDAALESPARDLHAVLFDRNMDQILGKEKITKLYKYYKETSPFGGKIDRLYQDYQIVWDSRVSGRFTKLVKIDGRQKYEQWIEGTVSRLIRGVEIISRRMDSFNDCLELLIKYIPYASDSLADKWHFN